MRPLAPVLLIGAWFLAGLLDRVQEAAKIIQSVIEQEDVETGDPWTCPECAETIDAQFAVCWNCGHEPSVARDAG